MKRSDLKAVAAGQGLSESKFEALDEGRFRFAVPAHGVVLELDFARRKEGQLSGELLVRCSIPGARTVDGILAVGEINLSSLRTRQSFAKYLAARARTPEDGVDFEGILEEFAQRTIAADRAGSPSVILSDVPRPDPEKRLDVEGLGLLADHPTILFGDGGTFKSYLALWAAGKLAQRGIAVGYFDWELSAPDHRDRLERLFGKDMPVVCYARCARPLVYEAERLRRIVRDEGLEFIVCDSVAFASDGAPENAEVAGRYFQALRQLGVVGSLHVAHVTKAIDGADLKPFGSAFWHNGARLTWNVKLGESMPGDKTIYLALHNRKSNLGAIQPSAGFSVTFGPDSTRLERCSPAEIPDLAAGMPIRHRLTLALRHGSMTLEALANEVEADPDTLDRTLRRYKNQFVRLDGGKVALLAKQSTPKGPER